MSLISKLKTLVWYLKRPSYYGQMIKLIRQRLKADPREASRQDAEEWCRNIALPTNEYLLQVLQKEFVPVNKLFPEEFNYGYDAAEKSPVKMGGPGNIDLVYHICEYLQADSVIETGVAYGWSTLSMLLSLKNRPNGRLISIDMPYAKMGNEDYVGCVVPPSLHSSWKLIRKPDRAALVSALEELEHLDLCHYDSDKSYEGRLWAYPRLWEKLRHGGYFISDDIGDNLAFKDFCDQIGRKSIVLKFRKQYVGILVK